MTTLAQRMKLARKHADLTQKTLAEKAGVEQPVISQLETGKNLQSAHLAKFAHVCGVSAIWLSDGIEPMIVDSQAKTDANVKMALQPQQTYRYPVISWVSAGAWAEAVQPYPDGFSDRYEISDYNAKGPAFWLEVKGDSMTAPAGVSVPEGMMILVDTEAEVLPGKLVIARLRNSDQATFKKLVVDGGIRYLKPLNPDYKMVECGEDCRIIGVAVRMTGKL
ncbi:helix-turn-helix domain-containing protein [Pseudomonas sp. LJDD11]|uniref:LexA family protein n=1 Tax=unclassified Pseudomonas TaxID=196821 RepID=UPI0020976E6A|nr:MULTISPECIES: S24 family peptidase [unclassified Pseudomonas]MCO8160950.1 helix-turn-helix domain-containing protein [Pseudomonas sp. 21LCFQ010]MCQ9426706.1 helix-turn-helix domain-containing protein [Pseudomonas sp. LJDD11]